MSMPPFDFGLQALAEFWANAGRSLLRAQGEAGRAFAGSVSASPPMAPGVPGGSPAGEIPGSEDLAQAAKAVSQLWKAAAGVAGSMASLLAPGGQTVDPTVEATFRAMADPRGWLESLGGMDSALGRVTEGVQLADLWQMERQQARLVRAWLDVRRSTLEHHAVVLEAWLRAGRQFTAELPGHLRANGSTQWNSRVLLSCWTETANRVLLETQRSEPFLRTQAAMVRAGTELRVAQTELAQRWAEQFNMPTRTELDDVHRTVTELRREVRALRKEARERARPSAAEGS